MADNNKTLREKVKGIMELHRGKMLGSFEYGDVSDAVSKYRKHLEMELFNGMGDSTDLKIFDEIFGRFE